MGEGTRLPFNQEISICLPECVRMDLLVGECSGEVETSKGCWRGLKRLGIAVQVTKGCTLVRVMGRETNNGNRSAGMDSEGNICCRG